MAPRLKPYQHNQIQYMIQEGFDNGAITCSDRSLRKIRSTFARFGTTIAPMNRTGPDPKITPTIADTLAHRLGKESEMTQREMADLISEEFGEEVSVTTIARAVKKRKTTLKVIRRIAQQQVSDLQHFYYYRLKLQGCRSLRVYRRERV
jgi:transposase